MQNMGLKHPIIQIIKIPVISKLGQNILWKIKIFFAKLWLDLPWKLRKDIALVVNRCHTSFPEESYIGSTYFEDWQGDSSGS